MTTPLVSIITPVHGARRTLAETAASVLAQTVDAFEWLVVVDDGDEGTYHRLPIMEDKRIRWFSTGGVARGPSVARNIGLDSARGHFLCHLDADDLMAPERLERLLPLANEHGIVTDLHDVFEDETGRSLGSCLPANTPAWATSVMAMGFNLPFFPLYRGSLGKRWDEEIRFSEDVLFNLALLSENGGMAVSQEKLLRYRVHAESTCNKMPQGYYLARDGYDRILKKLGSGGLDIGESERATLGAMFRRKRTLNEAFWEAYQQGLCSNFSEFAALSKETSAKAQT